ADLRVDVDLERAGVGILDTDSLRRDAKPQTRRSPPGALGVRDRGKAITASTGVSRFGDSELRRGLSHEDVLARAHARIGKTLLEELPRRFVHRREVLRLDARRLVPVEAEPLEVAQNGIEVKGGRAIGVQV